MKAARVRHGEVASDGGVSVVVVPYPVVVPAAAVEVPLHGVPLVRDVAVCTISMKKIQGWN